MNMNILIQKVLTENTSAKLNYKHSCCYVCLLFL